MSEDTNAVDEQSQPDIHEELYNNMRKQMMARDALYEQLMGELRDVFPGTEAQDVDDALNMTCVSLETTPLAALHLINTFFRNWGIVVTRRKEVHQ